VRIATDRGGPRGLSGRREVSHASTRLPAWPLLAWLYGFPLFWLTGFSLLAPLVFGGVMLFFLAVRGRLRAAPGVLVWFAFLAWVCVCAASLTGFLQAVGFAQRTSDLVAVGLALLYYVNARESISPKQVLLGFAVIWSTVVVLGALATVMPDVRISTPFARVIPGSLLSNELVRELVEPRLAEVQEPWGVEEPFVRPAAPFPYTNSWGMAYALLTPIMVLIWSKLSSRRVRVLLGVTLLGSLYPAAQTSNRGMLLALAVYAIYISVRHMLAGNLRVGLAVFGLLGAVAAALTATGVFAAIAGRQEYSDTTTGRGTVYAATFEKVLESPLVGWATPQMDVTIGIALGTQGYAWTLMFCYGFVGLAIFLVFLARVLLASWNLHSPTAYVLHGLVATVGVTIWFYGLGVTQCLILVLAAAMLARARLGTDDDGANELDQWHRARAPRSPLSREVRRRHSRPLQPA
jgi:hypothetical protein